LFAEWLKGNWEDDERKRGKWIATKAAVAPFASIPVFSVAARYFENKALDKYSKFNVTPAFGMIEKVIDTIDLTVDMLGSEKHVDKVDYAIKAGDTLGHALGVAGTSQAAASAKYFVRLQRGQERPSNAAQATYDFVRGKPKERP
jgi:Na+/H+ antiporter NhaA